MVLVGKYGRALICLRKALHDWPMVMSAAGLTYQLEIETLCSDLRRSTVILFTYLRDGFYLCTGSFRSGRFMTVSHT